MLQRPKVRHIRGYYWSFRSNDWQSNLLNLIYSEAISLVQTFTVFHRPYWVIVVWKTNTTVFDLALRNSLKFDLFRVTFDIFIQPTCDL